MLGKGISVATLKAHKAVAKILLVSIQPILLTTKLVHDLQLFMELFHIVCILSLLSVAYCSCEESHVIYVDPVNGVANSRCWSGGIDLPCKTFSLAKEGKGLAQSTVIAFLREQHSLDSQIDIPTNTSTSTEEQPCPPWMFRDENSGKCVCTDIPYRSVHCDPTIPRTSLLDCYCMTYNERNETELGRCFFGCDHKTELDTVYNDLPNNTVDLNEYMCGNANRNSTMCGKCKTGYTPLVYSYELQCVNCTNIKYNWVKYIAVAYIPLTFFFFFVVLFKFSGTSPLMRVFISASQALAAPITLRSALRMSKSKPYIEGIIKFLGCVYGIWNLDFFRTVIPPICLDITPLQAIALDYAVAFYPLLLVAVTYILISLHSRDVRWVVWLWEPFHKCFGLIKQNWDIQGSVVNTFATFFLLSYVKILNVSYDLLVYTQVYVQNKTDYNVRNLLYFDASVELFSQEHLPYAVTGVIIIIVAVIMPLLFLIIYSMRCCQKCLNALHVQRQTIDMFVNCYQGYYKDGTNGTRDCRCFSVAFFVAQIITFLFFAVAKSIYVYPIGAIVLIVMTIIILLAQPYKEQFKAYTLIDTIMSLIVACLFIMATGTDEADIKAAYFTQFSYALVGVISFIPFVYFTGLFVWWIVVKKQFGNKCLSKLRSFLHANVETEESVDAEDMPDRMENPMNYPTQAAPLLSTQNAQKLDKQAQYGTAALF